MRNVFEKNYHPDRTSWTRIFLYPTIFVTIVRQHSLWTDALQLL